MQSGLYEEARNDISHARRMVHASPSRFKNRVRLEAEEFELYSYYWEWDSAEGTDYSLLELALRTWTRWNALIEELTDPDSQLRLLARQLEGHMRALIPQENRR